MWSTYIECSSLAQHLRDPDFRIVDCRFSLADPDAGRRAYRQSHVPGALYAHLEDDLSAAVVPGKTGRHPWPDSRVMAEKLGAWGISNHHQLVAYDEQNGSTAARLWFLLRWLGHRAVAVLNGGFAAWQAEGHVTSNAVEGYPAATFTADVQHKLLADTSEVERIRLSARHRLIDARARDRFRGEHEPIDRVAGHIPGARSLPFADQLSAGKIRPGGDIHERFRAVLGATPAAHAVVYCGSGVTACLDLLAAEHAGISGLRLYPGSFSEWIADGRRPVASGDE